MLPSGLPEHVGDEEDLARFLLSSSQFNAIMVKPSAFLPNPRNGETSVFRHEQNPAEELWKLGGLHVAGERTLHGAAMVKALHVRAAQLEIVASEPPGRHANIIGWPSVPMDPELEKAAWKERAAILAQNAKLVKR